MVYYMFFCLFRGLCMIGVENHTVAVRLTESHQWTAQWQILCPRLHPQLFIRGSQLWIGSCNKYGGP